MAEQRLKTLSEGEMNEEQRRIAGEIVNGPRAGLRGPFPALLRRPELADCARQMGDCIRYKSTLSPRLREIAILMVARHWSAHYEWHAHRKMSEDAGVEPAIADAIGAGKEPPSLSEEDRLVWQFSREVLNDHDVSDATYAAALARFDEPGIIDLVATLGYFSFVSMILNTARVPVPEGGSKLQPLAR